MSTMFGAGFGFLLALPILIAQWLGVIGLAKSGRNGAWWCMAVGTGMTTIGSILTAVFFFLMLNSSGGPGGFQNLAIVMAIMGGLSGLGSLLFMAGFAIHGLKSNRERQRVEELESILAAQGEQLHRQESGSAS